MLKKISTQILILIISVTAVFAQTDYDNYYKALAEVSANRHETAILYFTEFLKENPKDKNALCMRGEQFFAIKKYNFAIADFKTLNKLNRNEGLLQISKCYALKNMTDSSIYFLEKYLRSPYKISSGEIRLDTSFSKIKSTEVWLNLWKKEWYNPKEISLNKVEYLIKNEDYLEAYSEVVSVLRKNKKNHKALFLKAVILEKNGNLNAAIKNYSKAIKSNSKNTKYFEARAKSYHKKGKNKKALADYSQAITLEPQNIELFYHRALIYNSLNQYENAFADIELYIKYFNSDAEALYNAGIINYNAGNYLNSLRYLNKAIEIDNSQAKFYYARANSYLMAKTYNQAIYDYNTAIDLQPNLSGEIYLQMGVAKLEQGETEQACQLWQKSLDQKNYKANNYIIKNCK